MGQKNFKIIRYFLECILDIVYPNVKCIICNEECERIICPACESTIKRINRNDGPILSYGYYGGTLKKIILKFKYEKNFAAGKVLANFLIRIIEENNIAADYICFVPMTKKSIKKRGYNQCEILADNIAESLDIPVLNCIRKIKDTKEQKSVSKEERYKNIFNAFEIIDNKKLDNKRIILIDDVTTTGATILECKKIIEKCNIKEIFLLTIAKSNI